MKLPIKQSEKEIQSDCMQYLQLKGWYVLRLNSGMAKTEKGMIRLAPAGTPDLMAFKKITFMDGGENSCVELIFIECKVPGNKPTLYQKEMMKQLEKHGAKCLVIHSREELESYFSSK